MKKSLVNETVLWRHAAGARFLWTLRQRVLRASQFTHEQRIRLDMRLDGHLEGLRLDGEAGWSAARGEIAESRSPGALFAMTALAIERRGTARLEEVIAEAGDDGPGFDAMVSAVGWCRLENLRPRLERWAGSADVHVRALGLAGLSAHRLPLGRALGASLRSAHGPLRARAAKAARDHGTFDVHLHDLLLDEDRPVRREAARALARLGERGPLVREVLLKHAESGDPCARSGLEALVELDHAEGRALFQRWARSAATRSLASRAAAVLGVPELVGELVSWMDDDGAARAAGDAFCAITGMDLLEKRMVRDRPQMPRDPNDDPNDPHVALDDEYDLAVPSRLHVARWWKAHSAEFLSGGRHIEGHPVERGTLERLAHAARPWHRTLAARALAQRSRSPAIETHAPATRVHELPGWSGEREDRRGVKQAAARPMARSHAP